MKKEKLSHELIAPPGSNISLHRDYDPAWMPAGLNKSKAEKELRAGTALLARFQDMLYAQDTYALLIIFQAMDAAGKDGTIKHVMSGLNPQGCDVRSFKAPSAEELDHDYLWRAAKALPERGRIGIFNRSYYEEVLIVRVHPEILERQHLPPEATTGNLWQRRYREINNFERYLVDNGIVILKFFLNLSKEEQRRRFLERIDRPEKNWKFSSGDAAERRYWADYVKSYEAVFNATSTEWAPWYIIPADHKWVTHLAVSTIICGAMEKLKLAYPRVDKGQLAELRKAAKQLRRE